MRLQYLHVLLRNNYSMSRMVSYFDAHCHMQLDVLWASRQHHIDRAKEAGLVGMCVAAINPLGDDFARVEELFNENKGFISPCFGLHPYWISRYITATLDKEYDMLGDPSMDAHLGEHAAEQVGSILREILSRYPAAGVGECGLDKRLTSLKTSPHMNMTVSMAVQQEVFSHQVKLAFELDRHLVCHCVGSWGALYKILFDQSIGYSHSCFGAQHPPIILHSCNGISAEMAKLFVTNIGNVYFSFSAGNLNSKVRDVLRSVPKDFILVETDSPDQALNENAVRALSPLLMMERGLPALYAICAEHSLSTHVLTSLELGMDSCRVDIQYDSTTGSIDDISTESSRHDSDIRSVNHPSAIIALCEILSQYLMVPHEEFCIMCTENARRVFYRTS